MEIAHGLAEGPPRTEGPEAAITIGSFDGVHRGHSAIVDTVVSAAREREGETVVITFDPHPRCVLTPDRCPTLLTTLVEKARLLGEAGVDVLQVLRFDLEMSRWPAAHFCDRLLATHRVRCLVVGHDFALGHNREGNVEFLRAYGATHGFEVRTVDALMEGEAPVSSSRIRAALVDGDVATAARLLGRPYEVNGRVERGAGVGHDLGFPTANLAVDAGSTLPGLGIYACWAKARGAWHMSATSVGTRPTFGGKDVIVEPHLLEFDGDLYGEEVRCAFVSRLRDEETYPDAESLAQQIARDVEATRSALAEVPPPRG